MAEGSFKEIESLSEDLKNIDKLLTRSSKETYLLRKNLSGIDKVIHTKNWEIISRFLSGTGAWRVLNKFKATMLTFMQLASIQERGALAEAQRMKELAQVAKDEKDLWKVKAALEKVRQKGDKQSIEHLEQMSDMFVGLKALYGDQDKALDEMEKKITKQIGIMDKLLSGIRGEKSIFGKLSPKKSKADIKETSLKMQQHKGLLESNAFQTLAMSTGFVMNAGWLKKINKQGKIQEQLFKEIHGTRLTEFTVAVNEKWEEEGVKQGMIGESSEDYKEREVEFKIKALNKMIEEADLAWAFFADNLKLSDFLVSLEEFKGLYDIADQALIDTMKDSSMNHATLFDKATGKLLETLNMTNLSLSDYNVRKEALDERNVKRDLSEVKPDMMGEMLNLEALIHQDFQFWIEEWRTVGLNAAGLNELFDTITPKFREMATSTSTLEEFRKGHEDLIYDNLDDVRAYNANVKEMQEQAIQHYEESIAPILEKSEKEKEKKSDRRKQIFGMDKETKWPWEDQLEGFKGFGRDMKNMLQLIPLVVAEPILTLREMHEEEQGWLGVIARGANEGGTKTMEIGGKIVGFIKKIVKMMLKLFLGAFLVLTVLYLLYRAFKSAGVREAVENAWAAMETVFHDFIYPALMMIWEGIGLIVEGFQKGDFMQVVTGALQILKGALTLAFGVGYALIVGAVTLLYDATVYWLSEIKVAILKERQNVGNILISTGVALAAAAAFMAGTAYMMPFLITGAIALALGVAFKGWLGLADGGTLRTSGLVKVGERGTELLDLPRGARVYSNADSKKMLNAGKITNITVQVQGRIGASDIEVREMADKVAREINLRMNRTGAAVTKFG